MPDDLRSIETKTLPLVTIGMPVFNGAATVAQALESLLSQDYPRLEIVISDNASTDETLTICGDYAKRDHRIRIIRKQVNEGAVANFRAVLEAAEGKYFMWAAADDFWTPSFVSSLIPSLEKDHDVGVVMSAIERRYPDGRRFDILRFSGPNDPGRMGHFRLFLNFFSKVKYSLFIYGLFRALPLKNAMQSFPDMIGGDRQFMSHLSLVFRFAYVDEILHVRAYQKEHEQQYWAEMAQPGTLWRQISSFSKMIRSSPIIPWWRKTMLIPVLPKFWYFNFRQTPSGRRVKYLQKAVTDKMNIFRSLYLSNRAVKALALFSILFVSVVVSLLAVLGFSLAETASVFSILTPFFAISLALIVRRWMIHLQYKILQTSIELKDIYIEFHNRMLDELKEIYIEFNNKILQASTEFKAGYMDELSKVQSELSIELHRGHNELRDQLVKELRYLSDILLHPELSVQQIKGNTLSHHISQRLEKHRKVIEFVRNLEESRIREVYLEELFPGIQNETVAVGVVNELTGHANKADMLYVSAVAKHFNAQKIFEFGTYMGRTTLYLARNNPQSKVFTLNLPPEMDPIYAPFLGVLFKNQEEEKRITQLYSDSREFNTLPYRNQFDFVFVDGDHSHDLVRNDTHKAFELLKPGGIIMWHDYSPKSPGLVEFFREFTQRQPLFRIRSTCLLVYIDRVDVMDHKLSPLPHSLELELRKGNPYLAESLYHS
jgi:glycosyltransferase involved in cell wall biosynthesis/predicted O-methyltransferase YrrM